MQDAEEFKTIPIYFKNLADLRNRIAGLWQDQKDDEIYEFTFGDEETMLAWIDLVKTFS